MSTFTDDQLFGMSDEELEAAFNEAKADEQSPDTEIEEEKTIEEEEGTADEVIDTESIDEDQEDTEEVDEEGVEDLEHPDDQDSDDDTSSDDEEEEDSEDDSETEEGDLDEEPEAEEEQTDEDEDESEEDEQPVQDEVLKFKANGQDYEFTTSEMKEQFGKIFGQAMDYTKKMQAIKPHRKTIDAIEQAGLTGDDINLMIDVLKGDKDAIAQVLKRTSTDALDLDLENSTYVAKDYGRNDTELDIRDIVDEISGDKEYAVTHNVLEKQWDDSSREEFVKDPGMIRLLHMDVKSGTFDKVNPLAQKLKVYDGAKKSDLEYYKDAAQQYFGQLEEQTAKDAAAEKAAKEAKIAEEKQAAEAKQLAEVKAKQAKQAAAKKASAKRKAAAPTKKAAGKQKTIDYLDSSDEDFEAWYNGLMDAQ